MMPEEKKRGKKGERLNARQERFVQNLLLGMTLEEAYVNAGYKQSKRVRENAWQIWEKPYIRQEYERRKEEMYERIFDLIRAEAGKNVETIKKLRDSSKQDPVRLAAARDLLDRGGLVPTQKHEVKQDIQFIVVAEE